MKDITRRNIASYDQTARAYEKLNRDLEESQIALRMDFLKYVPNPAHILDLGCGPGRDATFFTNLGYSVKGVDLSPEMIRIAKENEPRAAFTVGDMTQSQAPPDSIDGIWCCASLLCLEKKDMQKTLQHIHTSLKKGGYLVAGMKEGDGEGFEFDKRFNTDKYYAFYQIDELNTVAESAGFKAVKTYHHDFKSEYHIHKPFSVIYQKKSQ